MIRVLVKSVDIPGNLLPLFTTRPATFKEQSLTLKMAGYSPYSCGDCCLVKSRKMQTSDLYVIVGIKHLCGLSRTTRVKL